MSGGTAREVQSSKFKVQSEAGRRVLHYGLCILTVALVAAPMALGQYRDYSEIGTFLEDVAADHSQIARMYDLGSSEEGRHIWAIQISDNPDLEEDEPEFRYISTMHGDEWIGNEMCLYLIDHLTDNYGSDADITELVDEIDIWIVPLMNPDGYVAVQRANANGVDLNRDFPDPYASPDNTTEGRAAETGVIMDWTFASSFTLSANLHAGSLVVNYPFDNNPEGESVYTATPDDDLFIYISEEYSQYNLPMWNSSSFYHGITNGADWYAISGGMQDWNYHYVGSNEVTIELSNTKIPPASQIPTYWDDNRDSMLAYMATCLVGVRGIVSDASSGAPLAATITVVDRDHEIYSDPDVGDYHRMLLGGTYDLYFEAEGYDPLTVTDVVVRDGVPTRLDVELEPPPQIVSPNGGETLTVGVATDVVWSGNETARFQVQYAANYGDVEVVTDGFEDEDLDPEYDTGGDEDWYVTFDEAYSGHGSARAGDIGNNQVSWMTRQVGGGSLAFWYRVSSESDCDFFNFYIDDMRELHVSGNGSWTYYHTTLTEGSHELEWEYTKDHRESHYNDTVWIDELDVSTDNTEWLDIVALTDPGAMSAEWVPPAEGDDYKVRVRRAYDGGDYYGIWDESDETFSVEPGLTGDLNGDGAVDLTDLALLLAHYGECDGDPGYDPATDINNSGCTDLTDLALLLAHYGETYP